jgi:hypothetical protein
MQMKVKETLTLKKLVEKTGAPPYTIKYLYQCQRLPIVRESSGPGYPIEFGHGAIQIILSHVSKQHTESSK